MRAANDQVYAAQTALDNANHDLTVAQAGPTAVDRQSADNAVASAQRALTDAQHSGAPANQIADLQDALNPEITRRSTLLAAPDLSTEQAAVAAAQHSLASASEARDTAQQKLLPYLPANEVLFLSDLPRRVDSVTAKRGAVVDGPIMRASGAKMVLSASAAASDAKLLKPGATASFAMPRSGRSARATRISH